MRSTYITITSVCLGLFICCSAGPAFAGATSTSAISFAREQAETNAVFTLPSSIVLRNMSVARGFGGDFLVDVILTGGAVWNSTGAPTDSQLTISTSGTVTYGAIKLINNPAGNSSATYSIAIAGGVPTNLPTLTFTATGLKVRDVNNVLGGGGTIRITIQTRDTATGAIFDVGADTTDFMTGAYGVTVSAPLVSGAATIDISTNRTKFINNVNMDTSASIGIDGKPSNIYGLNGTIFSLSSVDAVEFRITGDLSGISTISWGNYAKSLGATDLAAESVILRVGGDSESVSGGTHGERRGFIITVDGTTPLNSRILSVTATLTLHEIANRVLVPSSQFLVWTLNGSVLISNWVNGNNAVLNSRIYLWNKNAAEAALTISVYTLPNSAAGSVLLGTLQWGTLPGRSGANIKLAEDILTPLGIALPYTTNGGNLILEIAVESFGMVGVSQTFSSGFAYGTFPLALVN